MSGVYSQKKVSYTNRRRNNNGRSEGYEMQVAKMRAASRIWAGVVPP